jgi:hypothetical protein
MEKILKNSDDHGKRNPGLHQTRLPENFSGKC